MRYGLQAMGRWGKGKWMPEFLLGGVIMGPGMMIGGRNRYAFLMMGITQFCHCSNRNAFILFTSIEGLTAILDMLLMPVSGCWPALFVVGSSSNLFYYLYSLLVGQTLD
jgi:hypothetical protein